MDDPIQNFYDKMTDEQKLETDRNWLKYNLNCGDFPDEELIEKALIKLEKGRHFPDLVLHLNAILHLVKALPAGHPRYQEFYDRRQALTIRVKGG